MTAPLIKPEKENLLFRCKRTDVLLTNLSTKRFELLQDGSIQEECLPAHTGSKWQAGRTWLPHEYDLLLHKP